MTSEEMEVLRLIRASREQVIKIGTYELGAARSIVQDHPFYETVSTKADEHDSYEDDYSGYEAADNSAVEEDVDDVVANILSNNFKTGMSQAEVDLFMSQMAFS